MLTEKDFLILDAIHRHQPNSQRELARYSGISLGKTNYLLKKLVDQGYVKVSKCDDGINKGGYVYHLTSQGKEVKERLTVSFVKAQMREFEDLRHRLLENLLRLQKQGVCRLLVFCSKSLETLLAHIARVENVGIQVVGTACSLDDLESIAGDSYDKILFADHPKQLSQILESHRIAPNKVTYLK